MSVAGVSRVREGAGMAAGDMARLSGSVPAAHTLAQAGAM